MDPLTLSGSPVASTSSARSSAGGFSSLSTDEFSKIIFTELSNQDPLQPNDTKALLEQLSTLRSIQSDMDLSQRLTSLASQSEFAAAANLLGKRVSGVSEDLTRVAGQVASISRTDAGAVLTLADGSRVRMSNLDEVVQPIGGTR